jgi:hypothetical protein
MIEDKYLLSASRGPLRAFDGDREILSGSAFGVGKAHRKWAVQIDGAPTGIVVGTG